ncbi:MAG: PD-(D/E)XK nuclease family protein [Planctomycetota bacterium]
MAIVHELSWSTSRARTFAACPRRYYFDYYLSWLGWERNAAPERRKAYLLKKMSRFPMLAGDLVHQGIAEYFRRRDQGLAYTLEEAKRDAVTALRAKYKESRDGAWKARPSKLCRLAEHHYEEPRIDEATGAAGEYGKRYVARMEACLTAFFEAPELADVRASEPASWLACEEMSTFELFGTKVFAVPDFAYRAPDGRVHILDWKTGSPRPEDRFQLEVYAFYARETWGAAPEEIVAEDVYLESGERHAVEFTDATLAAAEARIERSLSEMKAAHFDADRGVGDPSRFPALALDSPEARECRSCNYRELCDRAEVS